MFAFFLSSGLFLGWSLGANDAANVFGSAVGARMISFRKAAIYCGVFVILGAVLSGAGAARTLSDLGGVTTIAGAFVISLAAGVTVYWLTSLGYPVSTTQSIVGAILGWDLFSGNIIDWAALEKIALSWLVSPLIAGICSAGLYKILALLIKRAKIHMFNLDSLTRSGLLIAGIAGAYALGANNIANVVGIFVPVSPLQEIAFGGWFKITAAEQLFLLGGISIAVGTLTYGERVMLTVGRGITQMSPVAAFVAVAANALVLFLFASQGLRAMLLHYGLPAFPLVPVSSSQAIVGSIIGIGMVKGRGRAIHWRMLGEISVAWAATPAVAILISFGSLFIVQNVFQQRTYIPVEYQITAEAEKRLRISGIPTERLAVISGKTYRKTALFQKDLIRQAGMNDQEAALVMKIAKIDRVSVTINAVNVVNGSSLTNGQKGTFRKLWKRGFEHCWQLEEALANLSPEWREKPGENEHNKKLRKDLDYICRLVHAAE